MVTTQEVVQAYLDCRQNKRTKKAAIEFEMNLERNLMSIRDDLNTGRYQIGQSICFVVSYPKWREVWAAQFRDRVVHHILYNRLADRFHRRFIYDSYACIPGRGTLMGVERIEKFAKRETRCWSQKAYFLQADVANFFVSIDKTILQRILHRHIGDDFTKRLTDQVLFNDPTARPVLNSPDWKIQCVPRHKSLFNSGGKGLPIGNLSSQFFANVYMNELDQFVKRELKIKSYGRYVDDVVLLHRDPAVLNQAYDRMCEFVSDRLGLLFHPKKKVMNTADKGINFCGYVIKPFRRYVRRRTTNAMMQAVKGNRNENPHEWYSRVNSYLGICNHAASWNVKKRAAIESGATFAPNLTKAINKRKAT